MQPDILTGLLLLAFVFLLKPFFFRRKKKDKKDKKGKKSENGRKWLSRPDVILVILAIFFIGKGLYFLLASSIMEDWFSATISISPIAASLSGIGLAFIVRGLLSKEASLILHLKVGGGIFFLPFFIPVLAHFLH